MLYNAYMIDSAIIGLRVKDLRDARGWSLRMLADKAHVSHGYIKLLEDGQVPRPGAKILGQIASALGVDLARLIDGMPLTPEESSGESTSAMLDALPVDEREELEEILKGLMRIPRRKRRAVKHTVDEFQADNQARPRRMPRRVNAIQKGAKEYSPGR